MSARQIAATVLEALGVLAIAAALGLVVLWAGILALGVGMVLFGVALERADKPSTSPSAPLPPNQLR